MPESTALNATKCARVVVGDDARQRRLAGARRSPEDDRLQAIALDRFAQRLAGREQLLLADELVERARTHALGERRQVDRSAGLAGRVVGEQIHQGSSRRCRDAS